MAITKLPKQRFQSQLHLLFWEEQLKQEIRSIAELIDRTTIAVEESSLGIQRRSYILVRDVSKTRASEIEASAKTIINETRNEILRTAAMNVFEILERGEYEEHRKVLLFVYEKTRDYSHVKVSSVENTGLSLDAANELKSMKLLGEDYYSSSDYTFEDTDNRIGFDLRPVGIAVSKLLLEREDSLARYQRQESL